MAKMERIKSLLLCICIFIPVFAIAETENAVTLVSYEQTWLDDEGTLALKNNTNAEIHEVEFRITYLDMKGKALDYKDFVREVSIAPGMTKKVDIPAYEQSRHYQYYTAKDHLDFPTFDIKFELLGYNNQNEDGITSSDEDTAYFRHDESAESLIALLFIIGIYVGLYILVAVMAQQRNRSAVAWVFLSLVATPLLIIIILLCIGKEKTGGTYNK